MSTTSRGPDGQTAPAVEYPTRDGRPLGETDIHRRAIVELIELLEHWYAGDPLTYVSGNLMLYYVQGNSRKHLSPDVMVTRGIRKQPMRKLYLVWEEGRAPELVIEVTSKSTRNEDLKTKLALYRDVLHVTEYFLFDPEGEYLRPQLQGYRLMGSEYVPLEPVDGRLASEVTGLHLEASGPRLRLWDPTTQSYLLTAAERAQRDSLARQQESLARQRAEERAQSEMLGRLQAEENERRLQAEIERLKGTRPPGI